MVQEKGSRERCSSWTVLHAQSTSALSFGFPLSQGNAETLDGGGGKTKHRLISYFLGNTSVKNYRNRIVYVKIICSKSKVGRFLRHSVHYCSIHKFFLSFKRFYPLCLYLSAFLFLLFFSVHFCLSGE